MKRKKEQTGGRKTDRKKKESPLRESKGWKIRNYKV